MDRTRAGERGKAGEKQFLSHVSTNLPPTNVSFVRRLLGFELYSITFIWDYVQFGFQSDKGTAGLSAFARIEIVDGESSLNEGEPDFKSQLVRLIGKEVTQVHLHESLDWEFSDGRVLRILIDNVDANVAESAILSIGDECEVWRPGER